MICPFETYTNYCPFCSPHQRFQNQNMIDNLYRQRIAANTQEIRNVNSKINEYLRIPILRGNINPQILSNINTNIKNDILEFKTQMETAADYNAEQAAKQGKKVIPYIISNIYSITYDRNNILSLSLLFQENIDGRNSFIRTSYNYDLNTGKPLALKDLFKPNVNYISILNREIRRIIQQNPSAYFKDTLKNFNGIAEDQPFYLDDNELSIYFGFNEIAPIASEIPIIKIPLYDLHEVLKNIAN